jgi:exoribonuclease R
VSDEGESELESEESHSLVEEFMLLANCSVAQFTLEAFREYALLRRHPTPPPGNFEPLLLAAKAHGIQITVDNGSKALNESIERQAEDVRGILRVLTTRCMTQALYCCSGTTPPDQYHHFGLAVGLYTHFTSPIRRSVRLCSRALPGSPCTISPATQNTDFRHILLKITQISSIIPKFTNNFATY